VLKILQHDKIWGTIPPLQILGDLSPRSPVIYAHARVRNDLLGVEWDVIPYELDSTYLLAAETQRSCPNKPSLFLWTPEGTGRGEVPGYSLPPDASDVCSIQSNWQNTQFTVVQPYVTCIG